DGGEEVVRKLRPVGGHPVDARDCTQRHHVPVRAAVAHHTDGPHSRQNGKRLPRVLIETELPERRDEHVVDARQQSQSLLRYLTYEPYRQAGAWEGVTVAQVVR